MAEKKISLDLEINKGSSDKSVKSIKTELKEAKEEAIALARKFGELSPEATMAAKKLASLKDEMGDLNDKVAGLNPDKFARLSTLTNGVVRGFQAASGAAVLFGNTSEDIEKTIAKLQATMAFADGIQGVMDARKSFVAFGQDVVLGAKKMVVAVQGFSKASKIALAATGIGLIVIALSAIVTYWDDIKEAMSGVSAEQKKINKATEENLKAEKKKLDHISDQDNILKLQGLSEREILKLKIKQTDETIAAAEANIQNSIQTLEFQIEAEKRNKEILQGLLNFLSLPITALLRGIDAIGSAFGKNFGLMKGFSEGIAGMIFDPDKTKKKGKEEIQAQKDALLKLKDDRAKFKLDIKAIDKKVSDDGEEQRKKDFEAELKNEQAKYDEYKRIHEVAIAQEIQEEKERDERIKYREEGQARFNQEVIEEAAFQKAIADKAAADKKEALEKELKDLKAIEEQKQALRLASLDNIAAIGNLISQLAGKNKTFLRIGLLIEQAAAIAKMVINTQAANVAARAQGLALSLATGGASVIAAEALVQKNNISTGISIASSIAATAKAMQQLGGGSGGTTPSLGGGGGGGIGIQAPQTGFTQIRTPNQNPNNNQQKQPPVKVFVVQKDIQEATIAADRITAKAVVK